MNYVDGFVLSVPKKNILAYKKIATKMPLYCKHMAYGGFQTIVAK